MRQTRSSDKCLKGIRTAPLNLREAITAFVYDNAPDLEACGSSERMITRAISRVGDRPPRCFVIHLHEDGEDGSVEQWTRNNIAALRETPVLVVLGAREDGG